MMPIYEFHCKTCRSEFRTLRRTEQTDGVCCPNCQSERVARLLSVTARTSDGATGAQPEGPCGLPLGGGCCGGMCRN